MGAMLNEFTAPVIIDVIPLCNHALLTPPFIWFAIGLAIAALAMFCRSIWIAKTWITATAEITGYSINSEQGESTFYHPEFMIKHRHGPRKKFVSRWGSWRKPWTTGTEISVLIHPNDSERVEINCLANLYGIPTTLMGLALSCLAFSKFLG